MRETIKWVPVSERMPDADETVLIYAPGSDDPVGEGWFDGTVWRDWLGVLPPVTHYATMPKGPSK